MLFKEVAKMTVNSSPNLFRLSLPEWLKEQVDSGNHKGVYWINEDERIFHVPWKHASRNGWEDDDVSLFRAWAIYTNRYRVGIDKPRPALWKTNFRCAINSHNSISFLKDQGQRKGDKAHRIMRIIDPPKKNRSRVLLPDPSNEVPRKFVRLTYPNFGPPPSDKSRHQKDQDISSQTESLLVTGKETEVCDSCNELKEHLHFILENAFKDQENLEQNTDYLALKTKYVECITTKEHVCFDEPLTELVKKIIPEVPFVPSQEIKPKPNLLQDLYYIGKALQLSGNDMSVGTVEVKTENIVDTIEDTIVNSSQSHDCDSVQISVENSESKNEMKEESESENKDDSFFDVKDAENIEISEEEDDLITPRNT